MIARFVRHCPFCISRRNGSQQSPLSLGIFLPATPPTYSMVSSTSMSAEDSRQRAPSMITSSSSASSNASYPEEMMMMAAAAAQHQHQQDHQHQQSMSPFGAGATLDMSWQTSTPTSQQNYYAAEAAAAAAAVSVSNTSSIFGNHHQQHGNHSGYYPNNNNNNTRHQSPYMLSYPSTNSHNSLNAQESQQPMTMQPALSVYYAQEYGLKQNPAYSLIDTTNNMTFVPRSSSSSLSRSHNNLLYSPTNANANTSTITTCTTTTAAPIVSSHCVGSPSLSPSSSSTSATSSPVHSAYHETTSDSKFIQHQQACQLASSTSIPSTGAPANPLSLLSHHQSLF